MSEYQYFEFQCADRRLAENEMAELRRYSTRAKITPTCFINEYNWGDFKGDTHAWMEKYFDGHLYLANWGTHVLQLALSAKLLSKKTVEDYCVTDFLSVREKSGRVILCFASEDEDFEDFEEGDGQLLSLMPIRSELARGDLRALYLAWLLGVQNGHVEEGETEPPVPPNLANLSGALSHFVEFLRIDPKLIAVAAQASAQRSSAPDAKELMTWIGLMPTAEKDKLLFGLMKEENSPITAELFSRFNAQRAKGDRSSKPPRRKVAELLEAAGMQESES
jgi:hypothetical protein